MTRVLIVGSTSAIAQSVGRHYARDRARLFLTGRHPDRLAIVGADLAVYGADVENFLFDATDLDRHTAMLDAAEAFLGAFDVVLIAYGTLPDQERAEQDAEVAVQDFTTNATSVIALLTLLANRMAAQGFGTISVISSVAGDRGRPSNYVYGAAKGAVSLFLQGLRARLAKHGVAVVTIKPGFVDTPMTAHLPKNFLFASPDTVARQIVEAVEKKRNVVYIPGFWRPVMAAIRAIPESVFKKLSL